jgi:hypothetical protein
VHPESHPVSVAQLIVGRLDSSTSGMKTAMACFAGASLAVTALASGVVITSLSRDGELTWIGSVSNATYRVEWSSSMTGPWQAFDALTNLSLISATSTEVSVHVPMFYRVVWLDPPPAQPAGVWEYRGYDEFENLVVVGFLTVTGTDPISGTYSFHRVDFTTSSAHYTGQGELTPGGHIDGVEVRLDLSRAADNSFTLTGQMLGDEYWGMWEWSGFVLHETGRFVARRNTSPPDPSGMWEYRGFDLAGHLVITGRLSMTMADAWVLGTWHFEKTEIEADVGPQIGSGELGGGALVGASLSFGLGPTTSGERFIWLAGDVVRDLYVGAWYDCGIVCNPAGTFVAEKRRGDDE